MAAEIFDTFGRAVSDATMSMKELKGVMRTLLQGNVGKPTARNNTAKDQTNLLKEIKSLLTKHSKDYDKNEEDAKKYYKDVIAYFKDFKQKKDKTNRTTPKKTKPDSSKAETLMAKQLQNLHAHATKKGSLYTHDIHCENILNAILNALQGGTSMGGPPNIGGGGKGGGGGSGGASPSAGDGDEKKYRGSLHGFPLEMSEFDRSISNLERMLENVHWRVNQVAEGLMGFNAATVIFKDLVDQERKFTQEVRATAYEIEGVTKNARGMQRVFEKIEDTTKFTGKNRTELQENYIALLKKGVKDQKKALNVSIAQLNTEEQLGLKAGELQHTFSEWAGSFKMNTGQIADMGRGLRDVARFTGVTGENLKNAVESSKEFTKNMKNAATLTATAAKNIIEIAANAEKFGATEALNPLLKAMSSTTDFYHTANMQQKALLVNAAAGVGRINDLMNGTLLRSKKGIKDMAHGLEQNLRMFGVEGVEAIDKLSDEAKRSLNLQLHSAFGLNAGELKAAIEALRESGKGMAERLSDINTKLKQNLTLEEKTALLEEQRRLKTSKSLEIITAIDEAAKGAGDMSEALAKFGQRRKDFEDDMQAMGQAWTSEADVARTALQTALGSVNDGLKKAGKKELKINSSDIEKALSNPVAMRELSAQLSKAEQEAATATKAQLDPLTSMKQSLMEINDNVRQFSQKTISTLLNSVIGKLAIIASVIGILAQQGAIKGAQMYLYKGTLESMGAYLMKKLKEKFGKKPSESTASSDPTAPVTTGEAKLEPKTPMGGADCDLCTGVDTMIGLLKRIADGLAGGASQLQSKDPLQKKDRKHTKDKIKDSYKSMRKENQIQAGQENLLSQQEKIQSFTPTIPKTPEGGFDIKKMLGSGQDMAQAGAAILIMAAGIIALGAAVVLLGNMVMKVFRLDPKQVMETAGAVAAIGLAGGAIAVAAIFVMDQLRGGKVQSFADNAAKDKEKLWKAARAILIIGPGLILLGTVIVGFARIVTKAFGLNPATVAETAATVAAVAGAAAAITIAAGEALEAFDKMESSQGTKRFLKNPSMALELIGQGAIALLLLGPALILLGAAIVKISQGILSLFGLNSTTLATVAKDIAALLLSTALIAGAVIGSMYALAGLGLLAAEAWAASTTILIGAGALLLLTPAILALAGAVVSISQGVMAAMGLDANKAEKIASNVAGILLAAGKIALGVLISMWALTYLGQLGILIPVLLPFMIAGAAALSLMTVAMVGLAQVIMNIADGVTTMDSNKVENVVNNVKTLLGGAGSIALAVIGSMVGLTVLGVLANLAPALLPLMIAGSVALLLMTPAMLGLAQAVLAIADGIVFMDAKATEQVVGSVKAILEGAGDIAWACVSSMASLALLGLAVSTGIFFIAAALMGPGALGLMLMIPAMSLLATAVLMLAKASTGGMPAKEAKQISESTGAVFKAAGEISNMVVDQMENLMILGVASLLAPLILPLLGMGAAFLVAITLPIAGLAIAMINLGKMIVAAAGGVKGARSTVEGIKLIADMITAIGQIMDVLMNKIVPMTTTSWYNFWSSSDIEQIKEAIPKFQTSFGIVIDFVKDGITEPLKKLQLETKGLGKTIRTAHAVGALLTVIGDVMTVLIDKIVPMTTVSWYNLLAKTGVEKIAEAIEPFKKCFKTIVKFVKEGIIDPIQSNFPEIKQVQGTLAVAKSITTIMVQVVNMLDVLSNKLMPLLGEKTPVWQFWRSDKPNKLQGIVDLIPAFSGSFRAIAQFVKFGIVEPLKGFEIKGLAEASRTVSLMTKMITNIPPMMKSLDEAMKLMSPGDFFNLDFPMDRIMKAIPWFSKWFKAISTFIRDGIVNPIVNELGLNVKELVMAARILRAMAVIVKAISGIMVNLDQAFGTINIEGDGFKNLTSMIESGKLQGLMQALSVFGKPGKMNSNIQVATASKANVDVQQKIQQDKAGTQTASSGVPTELSDIAASTKEGNNYQQQMVTLLTALVSYLKPSSQAGEGGGGSGETQANMSVTSPPKYYKWTTGKHNQTAGKAVLNIGAINS